MHWLFIEICLSRGRAQRRDEALAVRQAQDGSKRVEIWFESFHCPVQFISGRFLLTCISLGINSKNQQFWLKNKVIGLLLDFTLQYGALDIFGILCQNDILISIDIDVHIFLSVKREFIFLHSFWLHELLLLLLLGFGHLLLERPLHGHMVSDLWVISRDLDWILFLKHKDVGKSVVQVNIWALHHSRSVVALEWRFRDKIFWVIELFSWLGRVSLTCDRRWGIFQISP